MTRLKPISVEGSCGHKFNIIFPFSLKYYLNPEFFERIITGKMCWEECPYCKKDVIIYYGLVVDTVRERICIYPDKWRDRNPEKKPEETIIFEKYGGPFKELEKYLMSQGDIDENGNLSEEYIPTTLRDEMLIKLGTWEPKKKLKNKGS